jgi:hypothetical protein
MLGERAMEVQLQPNDDQRNRTTLLETVAWCLPIAALLVIVGGVVQVLGYDGVPAGDRFYAAASAISSPFTALLALIAVVIVVAFLRGTDTKWVVAFSAASVVSLLVVVGSIATIWHALTVEIHLPESLSTENVSVSIGGFGDGAWSYRLAQVLRALSAAAVAGLTLFVTRRHRPFR